MTDTRLNTPPVLRQSIERFIDRIQTNLWPDQSDNGVSRWQVDSMDMVLTRSDGQGNGVLVTLRLVPGVQGLQVEWNDTLVEDPDQEPLFDIDACE